MGTARYTIQVGDEIIKFEGPDGLSDAEIEDLADKQLRTAKPGQSFPHSRFLPPEHDPSESSVAGSFFRNVPKDATFNFGDELTAAGNAAIPGFAELENVTGLSGGNQQSPLSGSDFWSRFQNNMKDYEAQQQADDALHPTASSAGRVLGLLGSIPRAGAAVAARLPQAVKTAMEAHPILTAVGLGGASGAVSGAGEGRGNRGQSAALGGIAGTVFGTGIGLGMELLPAIAKYGKIFLNKASHTEAVQQIIKALQRDGFDVTSPAGVVKLKSALQEFTGKPVSLADIGGATRSRAGVGLRVPNDAQQSGIDQIMNRQAGQSQRLATNIRQTVAPRTDVHALDDALVAQRAEEAKPLREKALFEDRGSRFFQGDLSKRLREPPPGGYDDIEDFVGTPGLTDREKEALVWWGMGGHSGHLEPEAFTPKEAEDNLAIIKDLVYNNRISSERLYKGLTDFGDSGALADQARQSGLLHDDLSSFTPDRRYARKYIKQFGDDDTGVLASAAIPPNTRGFEIRDPSGKVVETILPPGRIGASRVRGDKTAVVRGKFIPQEEFGPSGRQSRVVLDPQLQQLARLPMAQRALTKALDLAEGERLQLGAQGKDISHLPDLNRGSDLDMRSFDYLKRFLDDEVNRLYKKGSTDTFSAAEAQQVKSLRDAIRDRLREVNPEYANYLDAYKGSSEMIDALREGADYGKLAPEEIISKQAGRSEAGRELYRVGAARNLLDVLHSSRDTANPASRILNSDESRAQLAATGVSPTNMARLNRSVSQERVLNLLPRELSGSDTAKRLAAQEDATRGAHIDVPLMAAQPVSWLAMGGRRLLNRVNVNRNAAVNKELLPRLLETNPQAIEKIISELELQGKLDAARVLRNQLRARQAATIGGAVIGGPVALPTLED